MNRATTVRDVPVDDGESQGAMAVAVALVMVEGRIARLKGEQERELTLGEAKAIVLSQGAVDSARRPRSAVIDRITRDPRGRPFEIVID